MTLLNIGASLRSPCLCKCGRVLTKSDIEKYNSGIRLICSDCHQTIFEVEFEMDESWD